MLEIRHLTKIYKTKGGADVKALDDVSLNFEETGLVVLLGKSGSGKSTLLNLAGGLDAPTSGEIVVLGKSSKDFTGADFDSYRNTYVGFVFQEYNVLNEFNVEENISLALELQGKTKERDKVDRILEEVELGGYAKRKPNTLSGGQKQRIAIARALVKDPQIIMADEPTGALDSATGRQVFDTLKRLSKTRLVIVVSHDREFAEEYGDRIVELRDGKVISDVTKRREAPDRLSERVTKLGEDTLSVQGGRPDEETFEKIRAFLEESEGEILLSRGAQEIASFRRANRIDESGARESFSETEPLPPKEYDPSEAKFIRSRLPIGKAMKLGVSGLKLKPFRLVLTILLSAVSFLMFGLFSTMIFYDEDRVLTRSFLNSEMEYVTLEKDYKVKIKESFYDGADFEEWTRSIAARFTPAEAESFSSEKGQAIGAYSLEVSLMNPSDEPDYGYYLPIVSKAAYAPEGSKLCEGLIGRYPQKDDEICVSSYLFETLRSLTFRAVNAEGELTENVVTVSREEDLIGEKLLFNSTPLTVTGVFQSGKIPEKYERIKDLDGLESEDIEEILRNLNDYLLVLTYARYISEGLHSLILTTETFHETYPDLLTRVYYDRADGMDELDEPICLLSEEEAMLGEFYQMDVLPSAGANYFFLKEGKTSLTGKEVMLPISFVTDFVAEDEDGTISNAIGALFAGARGEKRESAIETLRERFKERVSLLYGSLDYRYDGGYSDMQFNREGELELAGFFISKMSGIYCSQEFYDTRTFFRITESTTNYIEPEDAIYPVLLVPFEHSESGFRAVSRRTEKVNADDSVYLIDNILKYNVEEVSDTVEILSTVFLVIGVVLALFSSLLLFNFITISISNKRREIGILRAVGARGTDVFKIFFSESGVITGICTLLSIIGSVIVTMVLNRILATGIGIDVSIFVFGPLSLLVMLGIAALVAFVSTFLPVYLAARKKPVESIRAL